MEYHTLVDRALITRNRDSLDRRRVALKITVKGEELVRELSPKLWAPLHLISKEMAEDEQRVVDALIQLGIGIQKQMASAAHVASPVCEVEAVPIKLQPFSEI